MLATIAALAILQSQDLIINDADYQSALNAYGDRVASKEVLQNNAELQSQLSRKTASVTLPNPKPLTTKESDLYTAARQATVIFSSFGLCGNCAKFHPNPASGFIVSPDGLVITNHHVIADKDASAFAIMTADKKTYPVVEVLASNETADIALVRVDAKNLPYFPVREAANPGETVYVLSHPSGHFYSFTRGSVSRFMMERGTPWVEITADYAGGSSGGPIMDSTGQIIGVVSMTNSLYSGERRTSDLQMVRKIAVPSKAILNLIKK